MSQKFQTIANSLKPAVLLTPLSIKQLDSATAQQITFQLENTLKLTPHSSTACSKPTVLLVTTTLFKLGIQKVFANVTLATYGTSLL